MITGRTWRFLLSCSTWYRDQLWNWQDFACTRTFAQCSADREQHGADNDHFRFRKAGQFKRRWWRVSTWSWALVKSRRTGDSFRPRVRVNFAKVYSECKFVNICFYKSGNSRLIWNMFTQQGKSMDPPIYTCNSQIPKYYGLGAACTIIHPRYPSLLRKTLNNLRRAGVRGQFELIMKIGQISQLISWKCNARFYY